MHLTLSVWTNSNAESDVGILKGVYRDLKKMYGLPK